MKYLIRRILFFFLQIDELIINNILNIFVFTINNLNINNMQYIYIMKHYTPHKTIYFYKHKHHTITIEEMVLYLIPKTLPESLIKE